MQKLFNPTTYIYHTLNKRKITLTQLFTMHIIIEYFHISTYFLGKYTFKIHDNTPLQQIHSTPLYRSFKKRNITFYHYYPQKALVKEKTINLFLYLCKHCKKTKHIKHTYNGTCY